MQNHIIRLAQGEDLKSILSIFRENIAREYAIDKKSLNRCCVTLKKLFKKRKGFSNFWVIIDMGANKVICWNSFVEIFPTALKSKSSLEVSIYIQLKYQENGYAFELMSFCLNNLRESDFSFVYGFANESKKSIHHVLLKLGFQEFGKVPKTNQFPYFEQKIIFIYQIDHKNNETLLPT